MTGRYEIREGHCRVPGVLAVVWTAPGEPPLVVFTIGAEALPALAEVLTEYLAGNPADAE
jgi:hypothetical protein